MPAVPEKVFEQNEYWRLFTAIGAHSDLEHFAANALIFGVLAFLLYGYFGWGVFPLAVILLSALVNALSLTTYPTGTRLVGASGAVYLMGAVWVTLYMLIDRRHTLWGRLLRAMGVVLLLFVPTSFKPEVSYRTHAIGFGVGVGFALIYFLKHFKELRSAEVHIEEPEEEPPPERIYWN